MKRYTINALKLSFDQEGLRYQTEKELSVFYLDKLAGNFRVDLIVEDKVVIEVKSLARSIPICLSVDRQFLSLNYFLI